MVTRSAQQRPDVSEELIERYGHRLTPSGAPSSGYITLSEPPTERLLRPMGPLMEITMSRLGDEGVEVWRFGPMPRLCFNGSTKRLWVLGRGFRFDGRGFHPTGGEARGLVRLPVEKTRRDPTMRGQLREFVRTHYGLQPNEALLGTLALPKACVALGYAQSIVYRTDRNDGGSTQCHPWENSDGVKGCAPRNGARDRDGQSPWEHPLIDEGEPLRTKFHTRPLLCTNPEGTGLWFHGGSYSVRNGWLVG